jgi:UDP-glucose 4-epimerase
MKILITGGAGYIGAHTAFELIHQGHEVTILDNMEHGSQAALDAIKANAGEFKFIKADLRNLSEIETVLNGSDFETVIHFAAYIQVGESVREPAKYFQNNTVGSQNLFQVLLQNGKPNVIFSSTAAVYGSPKQVPIAETAEPAPENPYGESKLLTEKILESYCKYAELNAVALRYFNPVGSNGFIFDRHTPITHLMPRVLKSLQDERVAFKIYGQDYNTPDGTGVRDYIHILDLVDAHITCMEYLQNNKGFDVFNVGTGVGTSVLEMVNLAKEVTGLSKETEYGPRREGDADQLIADASKIEQKMGWKAKRGKREMVESAWVGEKDRPVEDYL